MMLHIASALVTAMAAQNVVVSVCYACSAKPLMATVFAAYAVASIALMLEGAR
jgi:hypothetical protein